MSGNLTFKIETNYVNLKSIHKETVKEVVKLNEDYASGPGGVYSNTLKRIQSIEDQIDAQKDTIVFMTNSFRELMNKSDGVITKDIKNVQREKTEAQEVLETLEGMLKEVTREARSQWLEARNAAFSLQEAAKKPPLTWLNMKVSELLESCPVQLVEAMALDAGRVTAWLAEQAKRRSDAGPLPRPDLGDVVLVRLGEFHGEEIERLSSGISADRAAKLFKLEADGLGESDEAKQLRDQLREFTEVHPEFAAPPGGY